MKIIQVKQKIVVWSMQHGDGTGVAGGGGMDS